MSVATQFGANLARIRKRADMSQEEVSFRASVHRTEVSQLERGLRVARVDTVAKLAGALEVEPGEFFDGIKWESGDVRIGRFKPDQDATL
ncbi:MAG TPA: helix-turn-helix transcriptional regulator [Solirubrobacterales bacterium]|nr:helix-turn-helix transcriptional regulator [Solirubrobacterales bacterium]